MANPLHGEVWLVDLGMVAKIRPCLLFIVPAAGPNDRVLVTVVAHTTSARGSGFEVAIPARFLKPGVFDVQNIISIPHAKLVRRLASFLTRGRFASCWAKVLTRFLRESLQATPTTDTSPSRTWMLLTLSIKNLGRSLRSPWDARTGACESSASVRWIVTGSCSVSLS